ncbi:MAG: ATP synthase F1 subunit delta [Acidobacteria bacterium]|nr:MAG: ATP synthase F1 subunit delta [Acidobacteriota bacterium]PYY23565.1 MAG: ATP synthase F1 subunit delta [Acidobacteriota bacterium]
MASFVGIYARALADVVIDRKLDANRVTEELNSLETFLRESADLRTIWDTPSVGSEQKLKLLDAIAKKARLLSEIRNFAAVLISNGRIHAFNQIAREAIAQINEQLGIANAEIISTRELGAEEKHRLEAQVAKAAGKKLRVRYSLDLGLVGGVLVKVGSTVYDGSVRGQLQRIREQIIAS